MAQSWREWASPTAPTCSTSTAARYCVTADLDDLDLRPS
jgi:hypothetical protein